MGSNAEASENSTSGSNINAYVTTSRARNQHLSRIPILVACDPSTSQALCGDELLPPDSCSYLQARITTSPLLRLVRTSPVFPRGCTAPLLQRFPGCGATVRDGR